MHVLIEIIIISNLLSHSHIISHISVFVLTLLFVCLLRPSDGLPPLLAEDLLLQLGIKPAGCARLQRSKVNGERGIVVPGDRDTCHKFPKIR